MVQYSTLTIKLIIGLITLFIITKLVGKGQIKKITPFHFISALILGEVVGNSLYDTKIKLKFVLFAVGLWGVLMFLSEWLPLKFNKLRHTLEGNPSILIYHGKINREELKKNKISINQLLSLLRQKDTFFIDEVEHCILEPNGAISVLKKSLNQTPNRQDLYLPVKPESLPVSLIIDGEIIWDNLKNSTVDEQWLKLQLSANGIQNLNEVVYAEWRNGSPLYISSKEKIKGHT